MNLEPLKIVVLHIGGLTETTLGLPALRSLREHFKRSRILLTTSARAAELARLGRCADEILPVARLNGELLSPALLYRSLRAVRALRQSAFDLAIELHKSPESSLLLRLIKADERIPESAASSKGRLLIHTAERIAGALSGRVHRQEHLAQRYLRRLEPLGVRPIEAEPRLTTEREADVRMEKWLAKNGVGLGDLLVGIHPGAGNKTERWPLDRFASIGARLAHNFNARVIVISGPSERGLGRQLVKALPNRQAFSLQSPGIADLISLLSRLSVLITNHSGPAHIAAATRTPVVTTSAKGAASGLELLGRNHVSVRHTSVDMILEEDVYDAACRLIKANRADALRAL